MQRRDDRHRQAAPDHRHLLKEVGIAITARQDERFGIACGQFGKAHNVEARAECLALAREHDGADICIGQRLTGGDDRLCHLGIDRVHLVGSGQGDMGDVIGDPGGDAGHGRSSLLYMKPQILAAVEGDVGARSCARGRVPVNCGA